MTSNAWAEALLIAVLLAPLASVVLAVAVAVPADDRRWTTGGCAFAAVGAVVLLVTGQHPHVSRLAPDDVALAAAAASAFLAVGVRLSARTPVVAAAVTVVISGISAGVPGHASIVGPVLAIAGAIVLVTVTRDAGRLTIAAMSLGLLLAAGGARAGDHRGAAAVVAGTAVVAVAGSLSPRRVVTVLVPIALLLGLHVGPELAGTSTARWLAVALGAAGAALALLPRVVPRWASVAPGAALVPWTLAAAVGPLDGTPIAARALAAGTVVAIALGGPLALLAAAPGAAVFAYAVADGHGWPRAVLAVLVVATLIGLTTRREASASTSVRAIDGIAMAAAAWLVLRPTSWTWARVEGLRGYSDGTALAAATALIAGVLLAISGRRLAPEPLAAWFVAGEEQASPPAARVEVVVLAAVALMGLIAAALVRSPSL